MERCVGIWEALCHDRKGAFGRSYPVDDRIFRRNEGRGGVEPGETASKRSRVVYPSLGLIFGISCY